MELKRYNNMKTKRRKKSQTVVKDIEPKEKAKGSIEGGGKKLLRSQYLIHLSLIGILRSSTIKGLLEWSEMETIENMKYTLISGWERNFIDSKCIMKYWWPKQNLMTYEIIVNQSIIRCNYADKLSYWKRESKLIK